VEQVRRVRRERPGINVVVHPECPYEVACEADLMGSTEQILRAVTEAPAGSSWAVGTEANMVQRLAARSPDKYIRVLADRPPLCVSMARIDPPHLLWVLDNLAHGVVVNRVSVPEGIAAEALGALERMISIQAGTGAIAGRHG
jgi:quinolinate synthase